MVETSHTLFKKARLLDLPPEIRNMIWKLVILSPTGSVAPITRQDAYYRKFADSRSYSPHTYLTISSGSDTLNVPGRNDYITLSLIRTCRQSYHEASFVFWSQTTICMYLSNLSGMRRHLGPMPMALIRSFHLVITPLFSAIPCLRKTILSLPSKITHLSLEISKSDMASLHTACESTEQHRHFSRARYMEFLATLKDGARRMPRDGKRDFYVRGRAWYHSYRSQRISDTWMEEMAPDIHHAWTGKGGKGKFVVEEKLVWEDGRRRILAESAEDGDESA
ncbi:hypothetical protein B0O99DRAFT_713669 [Bisporella sp. PMI_857]|nr:hypothetical protein B0O99DRAFT_713669 [Bisporella sp. PMI_857]